MIRLDKESLPWRHYVAGFSTILIVFLILVYAFLEQNYQALSARDEVLQIQEAINELHVLSSKLKSAVLAHHRYILLGDPRTKEEYRSFQSNKLNETSLYKHIILPHSVEDDLNNLSTMVRDDPAQSERIKAIQENFGVIWRALDEVLDLHESGKKQEAIQKLNTYMESQVTPMRILIRDALTHETNLLKIKTAHRDKESNQRTTIVLTAILLFTILEIVFYTVVLQEKQKVQAAQKEALARANEVDEINRKLVHANDDLSALNKTIQESKEVQIKAIIEHALDGQIMMDADGTILRYNLAAERMFLYSPAEAIGKNIRSFLIEPYASECLEHFRQHKAAGICNGTEHRHESFGRRKNGTIFPIDLSMSMFDLGGALHFSWFLRDITDRKKSEADVLRYMRELEKSNQDLDDFAYIASHDLKEPLRGLFNHAQFLLEDYHDKLDADGQRRINRLAFLSQRMEHLVNDLLYFSRLGRSDLAIQKTDPNQIVLEIQHMLESLLKEKKARISIAAPMPHIVCDKPRIAEVFRNLITNGIKYNDKDRKEIEVGFLSVANAPHGAENNVFFVKDNGIGIEQQYFQEIFRIFRRLHKSDEKDQSTGAGLTFVKKIVERHNGHIWLESSPGQGTTFFFNLGVKEEVNDDGREKMQVAENSSG